MTAKSYKKLIHEGDYVAELLIERIDSENGWGPYLSLEDAHKLDNVRGALRKGDLKQAAQFARIFRLVPVSV